MDPALEEPKDKTIGDSMEGLESVASIEQTPNNGLAEEGARPAVEEADATQPEDTQSDNQIEVLQKPTYTDYLMSPVVLIRIGSPLEETVLSAHLTLLQKSPWFREACSQFSHATPSDERLVRLIDEDFETVGSFLEYLYVGEYTPHLLPSTTGKPEDMMLEGTLDTDVDQTGDHLLKHAKVYTLAGKLKMSGLQHLAHSKIHRINSTAKGELRYAKYVYEHAPKDDKTIRQPIASFWAHRSHVLRHEAEDEFKAMVLEFPHFAYDILSIVLDQKEKIKDRDHIKRPTIGGPADDTTDTTNAVKTPRTGRKRPRMSTS